MTQLPQDITTYLAWRFESVLPGFFRRDKREYAHIEFPILAPMPGAGPATRPVEGAHVIGPFIYFVLDAERKVRYVGKSKEATVVKRWVRPGTGGPGSHYWSHTNKGSGCIRRVAAALQAGAGPFELRFIAASAVPAGYADRFHVQHPLIAEPLRQVEEGFITLLRPDWNA
jgi:hypothetical protein